MNRLSADVRRALVIALVGIAAAVGLWMVVIAPKREDADAARTRADRQAQRLDAARTKMASYERAKAQHPQLKRELRRLARAVPAEGAISSLLRQLQREAGKEHASLELVALRAGSATPATGATQAPTAAPRNALGAVSGPGGLSALPFDLKFSGSYFDLVKVLRTVRRAVTERDGDVVARRRLLTIDGISFQRDPGETKLVASISATAFVAPDSTLPQIPAEATR